MATSQSVTRIAAEIMPGTPVFAGTRVPVQALLGYSTAGDCTGDFLAQCPTVTRERGDSFLELVGEAVTRPGRIHRERNRAS